MGLVAMMKKKPKDVPCRFCKGTGDEDTGAPNEQGRFITMPCVMCDGSGYEPWWREQILRAAREIEERWETWQRDGAAHAKVAELAEAHSFHVQARIMGVLEKAFRGQLKD